MEAYLNQENSASTLNRRNVARDLSHVFCVMGLAFWKQAFSVPVYLW